MAAQRHSQEKHWLLSVRGLVLIGFAAVAGFYLWTEHRAHLYGVLPYLLLLACPLMHLFMHRGTRSSVIRSSDARDGGTGSGPGVTMMHDNTPAYGLWTVVVMNSAVFILFAFSFFHPRTSRDWRTLGVFSAFIVALFTEMYGFPLTIYLLSGWLGNRFPGLNLLSHNAGHLLNDFIGWKGDPHLSPPHLLSNVLIFGGFYLLASAWNVLYRAQQTQTLAISGPYAVVRHPQYVAFLLIMAGFLLQWPTLLTVLMFPILGVTYVRLARREEAEVRREFGEAYDRYATVVPAFFPRLTASANRGRRRREEC